MIRLLRTVTTFSRKEKLKEAFVGRAVWTRRVFHSMEEEEEEACSNQGDGRHE
jgi:hypothetical protein